MVWAIELDDALGLGLVQLTAQSWVLPCLRCTPTAGVDVWSGAVSALASARVLAQESALATVEDLDKGWAGAWGQAWDAVWAQESAPK